MKSQELYSVLVNELPKSTAKDRQAWARTIAENKIDLLDLSNLLFCDKHITSRFMWLLTDVGETDAKILLKYLPYLLKVKDEIKYKEQGASFANYWLVCGVPKVNETQAIDLLFSWLQSSESNVTTKSRSAFVLFNLTNIYPELRNELKVSLEGQLNGGTASFVKRTSKLLSKL